jgi:hypothetical protein
MTKFGAESYGCTVTRRTREDGENFKSFRLRLLFRAFVSLANTPAMEQC